MVKDNGYSLYSKKALKKILFSPEQNIFFHHIIKKAIIINKKMDEFSVDKRLEIVIE